MVNDTPVLLAVSLSVAAMDDRAVFHGLVFLAGALVLVNIYASLEDIHLHVYPPPDIHAYHESLDPSTMDDYGDTTVYSDDKSMLRDINEHLNGEGQNEIPSGNGPRMDASSTTAKTARASATKHDAEATERTFGWLDFLLEVVAPFVEELLPVLVMLVALAASTVNNMIRRGGVR